MKTKTELKTGRLVQARTRKLIWSLNHTRKNSKVKLGLKNLAMLPNYFDYMFVHLKQKVRFRPELSPKFLPNLGSNPARTRTWPEKSGPTYNSKPKERKDLYLGGLMHNKGEFQMKTKRKKQCLPRFRMCFSANVSPNYVSRAVVGRMHAVWAALFYSCSKMVDWVKPKIFKIGLHLEHLDLVVSEFTCPVND